MGRAPSCSGRTVSGREKSKSRCKRPAVSVLIMRLGSGCKAQGLRYKVEQAGGMVKTCHSANAELLAESCDDLREGVKEREGHGGPETEE